MLQKKAVENPKDKDLQQKLNTEADKYENELDKLKDNTNAELINEVNNALNEERKFQSGVRNNDPKGMADAAKNLAPHINKIKELSKGALDRIDDPTRKKKLNDALAKLNDLSAKQINEAKDVFSNPDDQKKKDQLDSTVAELESVLSEIPAIVNPTPENELVATARQEQSSLAKLKDELGKGDKNALQELQNAKKLNDKMKEMAKAAAKNTSSPLTKQKLEDAAEKLDKYMKDLENDSKKAAANPNDKEAQEKVREDIRKLNDQIEKIIEEAKSNPKVDALAENKKLANFLANMGDLNGTDDYSDLWGAAKNLRDRMGGLLSGIQGHANNQRGGNLTDEAKSALELADLLKDLESGNAPRHVSEDELNKIFSELEISQPPPTTSSSAPKQNTSLKNEKGESLQTQSKIPEATNFHDNISNVAVHVKKAAQLTEGKIPKGSNFLEWTNLIAIELAKMAEAAKTGKRSDLIKAGRTISTIVAALEKFVKAEASKIKDPKLQARMLQNAQFLSNMGTQVKILSAVKASGGSDSDDQLVSVARSFGYGCSEILSTVTECHIRKYF